MAPCLDMDDFASDSVNTSIVYKDSGGDKNFSQETCTPFCTCACCLEISVKLTTPFRFKLTTYS
ncbi:MAG: hypothetical protein V4546_12445, partial [Bacteroidota bacterium]